MPAIFTAFPLPFQGKRGKIERTRRAPCPTPLKREHDRARDPQLQYDRAAAAARRHAAEVARAASLVDRQDRADARPHRLLHRADVLHRQLCDGRRTRARGLHPIFEAPRLPLFRTAPCGAPTLSRGGERQVRLSSESFDGEIPLARLHQDDVFGQSSSPPSPSCCSF